MAFIVVSAARSWCLVGRVATYTIGAIKATMITIEKGSTKRNHSSTMVVLSMSELCGLVIWSVIVLSRCPPPR